MIKFYHDQVFIRFGSSCSYDGQGWLEKLTGETQTQNQDGTYDTETTFEIRDVQVDENGISSCVYETYVGGVSFAIYDVSVTCSNEENKLFEDVPHISMLEFTDFFNSFTYFSPKRVESLKLVEQNTNDEVEYNYTYTDESDSQGDYADIEIEQTNNTTIGRHYVYSKFK